MKMKFIVLFLACAYMVTDASALILYGKDNSGNLTDPLSGVPYDAVAKVMTSGLGIRGTAVHLGDGYMLTAHHVETQLTGFVSFDGITNLALDATFTPQQVASGVDLKIFRLLTPPPVASGALFADPTFGTLNTHIGWGVGRDPSAPIPSSPVTWGSAGSSAKRWGLNAPEGLVGLSYSGYAFDALYTYSSSSGGAGDDEAALTVYDSGSPMFQEFAGQWFLTGIAVAVSTNGSSSFLLDGDDSTEVNANFLVPVKTYESQILAIIPEISPGAMVLLAFAACGLAVFPRKRNIL